MTEMTKLTEQSVLKLLNWSLDTALSGGIPGVQSVDDLVASYAARSGSPLDHAKQVVRVQITKASTAGFLTGLGGVVTLPVMMPVNLASVLVIQMQMLAAIAKLAGHDPRSDRVRTFMFACMAGESSAELLKPLGIDLAKRVAEVALRRIPGVTLRAINQKVGFRLVTKFGTKGVVNGSKLVPLVGAPVGALIDGLTTKAMGSAAVSMFFDDFPEDLSALVRR